MAALCPPRAARAGMGGVARPPHVLHALPPAHRPLSFPPCRDGDRPAPRAAHAPILVRLAARPPIRLQYRVGAAPSERVRTFRGGPGMSRTRFVVGLGFALAV